MARVRVRDQYQADHWIEEGQLAFEPWRSCEVIEHEAPEVPAGPEPPAPADADRAAKRKPAAAE